MIPNRNATPLIPVRPVTSVAESGSRLAAGVADADADATWLVLRTAPSPLG